MALYHIPLLASLLASVMSLEVNTDGGVAIRCNASDTIGRHLLLAHDGAGVFSGLIRLTCPVLQVEYVLESDNDIAAIMSLRYAAYQDVGFVSMRYAGDTAHSEWHPMNAVNLVLGDANEMHIQNLIYMARPLAPMVKTRRLWMDQSEAFLLLETGHVRPAYCPDRWLDTEPLYGTACHFRLLMTGDHGTEKLTVFGTATGSTFELWLPDGWVIDTTFRDTGHLVHMTEDGLLLAINPSGVVPINVTGHVDDKPFGPVLIAAGGNATITQLEIKPFYSIDALFSIGDTPVTSDNVWLRRNWGDAEYAAFSFLQLSHAIVDTVSAACVSLWKALF